MGNKKQILAINAIMSLVHDIQLARHDKEDTSVLFMDVKGAFDHVSANQLQKVCQNLGLPRSLCSWIECFINNRHLQLAFDGNKQEKTRIKIGIPQNSPVSLILFFIYIKNIFPEINIIHIRSPSYMDDIALSHFSKSIEINCKMLKLAVEKLLQL